MRRANSPFNLSLLDLLTAALGAVIFLFIITPKGGAGAASLQQASIFFDSTTMQIHGTLPDSLLDKRAGDTLFAMLVDYRAVNGPDVGGLEAALAAERKRAAEAEAARKAALAEAAAAKRRASRQATTRVEPSVPRASKPSTSATKPPRAEPTGRTPPKPAPKPTPKPAPKPDPAYTGTPPSVPARLSFELTWADKRDNVDLYVCQGNTCVYGNNKRERSIGNWDSGKSRNRLFGNDLRTNQEAVRQFDELLPGTYTIYAHFKESEAGRNKVSVKGLIYTKDDAGKPRGKTYSKTLPLAETRTRLITVTVKPDGTFTTR